MLLFFKSVFTVPTRICTERGVDQMPPLVHAGHGSVPYTLATLLYLPLARPALQGACSRGIREDAGRPIPMGLRQNLVTRTSLRLFQLHVQAMILLFTATWAGYRPKDWMEALHLMCHLLFIYICFKIIIVVVQLMIITFSPIYQLI